MGAFFMERTKVSVDRTLAQIQAMLARFNVTQMLTDYEAGQVSALSFRLLVDGEHIPFRLPCRWERVKTRLIKAGKRASRDVTLDAWARRVAWRQVFRWLEAQLALIETGMVEFAEVMLPYAQIGPGGATAYEAIRDRKFQAISDRVGA